MSLPQPLPQVEFEFRQPHFAPLQYALVLRVDYWSPTARLQIPATLYHPVCGAKFRIEPALTQPLQTQPERTWHKSVRGELDRIGIHKSEHQSNHLAGLKHKVFPGDLLEISADILRQADEVEVQESADQSNDTMILGDGC
jgi:hypothetical protein